MHDSPLVPKNHRNFLPSAFEAKSTFQRFIYFIGVWILNPIVVFVALQLVWVAVVVLWVIWFVDIREHFSVIASQVLGQESFPQKYLLAVLVAGCILLGMLLVGTIFLFVFGQKQGYRARQQRIFVSSVTHEFRTPLTSLQLTLETLRTINVDQPTREKMIGMAEMEIMRLTKLVDQILISGRFDRGIIPFERRFVEVKVEEILNRVKDLAQRADQTESPINIECPKDLKIYTAPTALTLIIGNLLDNALKYSPKKAPVTIKAKQTEEQILFQVIDQGIGIDRKDRRRIFKMFHRSSVVTKKAIPGTGLGLFIVKSAVSILSGHIWVESHGKDQGSTFHVSLPKFKVSV